MAELDYAFIADFAKVEPNGALTAVGASWTHLTVPTLPATHRMSIAGRIRASTDDKQISLRIVIAGPEDAFRLEAESQLEFQEDLKPYGNGKVGHLFALDLQLPLVAEGLYGVDVLLDGTPVRHLAFEVLKAG